MFNELERLRDSVDLFTFFPTTPDWDPLTDKPGRTGACSKARSRRAR